MSCLSKISDFLYLKGHSNQEIDKLRKKVQAEATLTEKPWLLQKIAELSSA